MNQTNLRYLALGGLFGPILFTSVFLICSSLRPGYDQINKFISELGATGTPNADLMNFVGFIPSGLMIAVFGISQLWLLPKGIVSRIGSTLIILFGVGMATAGVFSCDVGCPREGSFENMIHDQVSGPAFLCGIIGILLLGISFRKIPSWRSLWLYSVISALISLVFIAALINSIESYSLTGTWQRLLLLTIFLWCGTVGLRMFRLERDRIK